MYPDRTSAGIARTHWDKKWNPGATGTLRTYKCPECNWWHFGRMNDAWSQQQRLQAIFDKIKR